MKARQEESPKGRMTMREWHERTGLRLCVKEFKAEADFGASSTHGGRMCLHCRWCRDYSHCEHPACLGGFSLGTHPDRMGCRFGWEAEKGGER